LLPAVAEGEYFSLLGVIVHEIEGKYNNYCVRVFFAETSE
jgi:hypothetical protein